MVHGPGWLPPWQSGGLAQGEQGKLSLQGVAWTVQDGMGLPENMPINDTLQQVLSPPNDLLLTTVTSIV